MTYVAVYVEHVGKGDYRITTTSSAALRKLNTAVPEGERRLVRVEL